MKQAKGNFISRQIRGDADSFDFLLFVISIFALSATFALNFADADYRTKTIAFSAIAGFFLTACAFRYRRNKLRKAEFAEEETEKDPAPDVRNRLLALEEANEYFGAALKPADLLRLVSSRIKELVSFDACVFFISDESNENLKVEYAYGTGARHLRNIEMKIGNGLAGKTLIEKKPRIDEKFLFDKPFFPVNVLRDFRSSIAVPLLRDNQTFGVLQLFSSQTGIYNKKTIELVEAIAERVVPLFVGSIAFEKSLSNALTDPLTDLPNERAFYLVLENQVAESTRFQLERPLSILCVDINDFSGFNNKFGHATGDRFLAFTADLIKNQLRQMDFLARSSGDEFLIVLPTAGEKMTEEIINRIKSAFRENFFEIDENEKFYEQLNFGSATFGRDGETATQLLNAAILRKQQSKSKESDNVLWFPKECANGK